MVFSIIREKDQRLNINKTKMVRILGRRFFSLVIVAVAVIATTQTDAQNQPCLTDLSNCRKFYNNTALVPTEACCGPLARELKTPDQVTCLCAAFNDPSLKKQYGVNLQTVLELANRCNITGVDPNICTSAPPASPPTQAPTPETGTSLSPSTSTNGAPFKSEWIGFSTFFSLLLFIMA